MTTTSHPLDINHDDAERIAQVLVDTIKTENVDVVTAFAALQLAALSVADYLLNDCSAPEHKASNRDSLTHLVEHTLMILHDMGGPERASTTVFH